MRSREQENKKILGYRSTVGQLILDQSIGVRIPVPQPREVVNYLSFFVHSSSSLPHYENPLSQFAQCLYILLIALALHIMFSLSLFFLCGLIKK